jgi:hypothetical protein
MQKRALVVGLGIAGMSAAIPAPGGVDAGDRRAGARAADGGLLHLPVPGGSAGHGRPRAKDIQEQFAGSRVERLRTVFSGMDDPVVRHVLDSLDQAPDHVFDSVHQVKMPGGSCWWAMRRGA